MRQAKYCCQICETIELPWVDIDLRQITVAEQSDRIDAILTQKKQQFQLGVEQPLFQLIWIRCSDTLVHFYWLQHHITMDGWSSNQLFSEFMQCYAHSEAVAPVTVPYARFVESALNADTPLASAFGQRI